MRTRSATGEGPPGPLKLSDYIDLRNGIKIKINEENKIHLDIKNSEVKNQLIKMIENFKPNLFGFTQ